VPTLTSAILAAWHRSVTVGVSFVTVSPEISETTTAVGEVPETLAEFTTSPASISC